MTLLKSQRVRNLVLCLSMLFFTAVTMPVALCQIKESPTATPEETPSAMVRPHVVHKLPLKVKMAIAGTTAILGLAAMAFLVHRWRSLNLFDRQYRFPSFENVSPRLGAKKSGGCMATIEFGDASARAADSVSEDA